MLPRRQLAVAGAVLALAVGYWYASKKLAKRAAWKPLWQPVGVPKVKHGRTYFFLTHHKTGTNLMQRFCNITAKRSTAGYDECAFCLRLLPGDDGYLKCVPDPTPEHGRLRGTIDRFTLISSINGREFDVLRTLAPDFRAVHMIRHPVKIAISAHQYNKFVFSEKGKKWRWDHSAQDIANATSTREELLVEAKAILKVLRDMQTIHAKAKEDPRVLTLDLEEFEKNFDTTSDRIFKHMFENVTSEDVKDFVADASSHDPQRWTKKRQREEATATPRFLFNRTEALVEWKKLEEEGQEDVASVVAYVESMGYKLEG